MSTTTEYVTVTDTAKMLRAALKSAFPGVKFSVRSDKYAGGASIRVEWTDGPADRTVSAITSLYRGAEFDGMTDMKSYHSTLLAEPGELPRTVHMGADFVFTTRELSANAVATWAAITQRNGIVDETRPEQCRQCGDWMRGEVFTAHYTDHGYEHVDFCCSAVCAAKRELRFTDLPA